MFWQFRPVGLVRYIGKYIPLAENCSGVPRDKPLQFGKLPGAKWELESAMIPINFQSSSAIMLRAGCRLYLNCTAQAGQADTPQAAERFRQYYFSTIEAAALSNEIFLASSNLCGQEKGTHFGGGSPGHRASAPGGW